MLTLAEFQALANATGSPVNWSQAKAPNQTAAVSKAIVQSTKKSEEPIVNAYGVNGKSVQVAVTDLPVAPEKFDTFTDAYGARYVVDLVVTHAARGSGEIVSFTCYSKGKD